MSEKQIENEIREKGLNAPRLTPEKIDQVIIDESYVVLPSGKAMICELTLKNGFTVRGESACVSKENFDLEIGAKIAKENARNKIWELEGYLLQQRLFEEKKEQEYLKKLSEEPNPARKFFKEFERLSKKNVFHFSI